MDPIIADTNVWIHFFKGNNTDQVRTLSEYNENDYPVYLCPTIIQEILQGVVKDKQYKEIKDYLFAFTILNDDC